MITRNTRTCSLIVQPVKRISKIYVKENKSDIWASPVTQTETASRAGDLDSIPGSGRSPGEGNSNLLQYSCLENSMDRDAWWATLHGVAKS